MLLLHREVNMTMPQKQIPSERKALYYGGMILTGIGLLLFLSTFVTHLVNFGNFDHFEDRVQGMGFRAFGGMVLMVVGGFMMNVGAKGWSGSGVVLDPEKARKDVEPWSRMSGGVLSDALSEVEVVQKIGDRLGSSEPQVKIRCQKCQALNEESAKFCNQCGANI
jgi:RNA polymerase subunit RPABC4/transcription elongation factor Spt4